MYHSIALEDLLDLINLFKSHNNPEHQQLLNKLIKTAGQALSWLELISDNNNKIPLLNDSAYGISPEFKDLKRYSNKLSINSNQDKINKLRIGEWTGHDLSGYIILRHEHFKLIFDTAQLGPDYLPGHAHCDMLSVLLDLDDTNILTDTGVFEYKEGSVRSYSRSTEAHNTVTIDDLDQAEIWKSFRMGHRGQPIDRKFHESSLSCSHTGFIKHQKGLYHNREIRLNDNGFEISDKLTGPGKHSCKAFYHFAPGVEIFKKSKNCYIINNKLLFEINNINHNLTDSDFYPHFGYKEKRNCLVLNKKFENNLNFGIKCTYSS